MGNCTGAKTKSPGQILEEMNSDMMSKQREKEMKKVIKTYKKKLKQEKSYNKQKSLELVIDRLMQQQEDQKQYKENREVFEKKQEDELKNLQKQCRYKLKEDFLQKKDDFRLTKVEESSILSRRSKHSKSDLSLQFQ